MIRPVHMLPELEPEEAQAELQAGFGALETPKGRLPLRAMRVEAEVHGLVARVKLRQQYRNPLKQPLEATYIFPLPDRGAVTSFVMEVGSRRLEAQLKERAQAREEYDQAIQQGHRAAIAEEDRPEVFSLRVGNIPPQAETTVELVLVVPLEVVDEEATFRFPLVVAPRYVPGIPLDGPGVGSGTAPDTDQVPDASRVTPPVLLPGFPNPVQLQFEVHLHPSRLYAQHWQRRLACTLHSVVVEEGPPLRVRLQPGERLNRDFLLRLPLAAQELRSSWQLAPASKEAPGVFAVTVVPPRLEPGQESPPRDVVFVLDRSGSMTGWKIVAARRALGRMIDSLNPQDRFAVLAFDHVVESYAEHAGKKGNRGKATPELLSATNRNRYRAVEWLARLEAHGGTEMAPALAAAAKLLRSQGRSEEETREAILVVVTDGQVAGEDAVLRALAPGRGKRPVRVFAVGIDQAVNLGLLRRLAQQGRGWCETIESEDRLDEAMQRIHRTLAVPVLRGLRVCFEGWDGEPSGMVPEPLPEVFAGRPTLICGRLPAGSSGMPQRLLLRGQLPNGTPWRQELLPEAAPAEVLLPLWGRMHLRQLEDRYAVRAAESDPEELAHRIVQTSLESRVLSRFTAYVVVDRSQVVNPGGEVVSITQPVEMPQGWDMLKASAALPSFAFMLSGFGTAMASVIAEPKRWSLWSRKSKPSRRDIRRRRRSPLPAEPHAAEELVRKLRGFLSQVEAASDEEELCRLWQEILDGLKSLLNRVRRKISAKIRKQCERLIRRIEQHVAQLQQGKLPPEETSLIVGVEDWLDTLEDQGGAAFWK